MNSLSPYDGTPTQSRRSRNRPPSPVILPDDESDSQSLDTTDYLSWGDTQDISCSRTVTQLNVDSAQGTSHPFGSHLDGFRSTTQGWSGGTQSFDSFPRDTSAFSSSSAATIETDNIHNPPRTSHPDSSTHSAITDVGPVVVLDTLECMFSHDAALNSAAPVLALSVEVAPVTSASSQSSPRTSSIQSRQASPRLRQPRARTAHQTHTSPPHSSQHPPHSPRSLPQLQQSSPLSQWHMPLTQLSPPAHDTHQHQPQLDFSQLPSPQLAQDSPPHSPTPAPHSPLAAHVLSPLTQTQRLSAPVSAVSTSPQAVRAQATPREQEASPGVPDAAATFPQGIVGCSAEDGRAGDGDEDELSLTDGGLARATTRPHGDVDDHLLTNNAGFGATTDTLDEFSASTAPSGAVRVRGVIGDTSVDAVGGADAVHAPGLAALAMQPPISVNTPKRGGKAERTPARTRRTDGTPGSEGGRARGKKGAGKDKEKDKEKEAATEDAVGSETPRRGILSFFMGTTPAASSASTGTGTGVTVGGSLFSTSVSPHTDTPASAAVSARSYSAGEVVCIDLDSDAEDSVDIPAASKALIRGDVAGTVRARRGVVVRDTMPGLAPLDLTSLPLPLPVAMPVSMPPRLPLTTPAAQLPTPAAQAVMVATSPSPAAPASSSLPMSALTVKTEQWPADAVSAAVRASLIASTDADAGAGVDVDMGANTDVGTDALLAVAVDMLTKMEEEEADAEDWAFGDDGGGMNDDANMPSLPKPTNAALASESGAAAASAVFHSSASANAVVGVESGAEGSQWTQEQDWAFGEEAGEASANTDGGAFGTEADGSGEGGTSLQPLRGEECVQPPQPIPPVQPVKSEQPAALEWARACQQEIRVKREGGAEEEWEAGAGDADDWAFGDGFGDGMGDGLAGDELHRSQPRAQVDHHGHDLHSQADDWSFGANDDVLSGAGDSREKGYGAETREELRGAEEWRSPTPTRDSAHVPHATTPPPTNPYAAAFDDYAFLAEMSVLLVAGVELSTVLDAVHQQARAGVLSPAQVDRICGALKHTHASLSGGSAPPPAFAPTSVPAASARTARAVASSPPSVATTPAKPAPAKASRTPPRGKPTASVAPLPRKSPQSRPTSAPAPARADVGVGRGRFRVSLLQEESESEGENENEESEAGNEGPRRGSRAPSSRSSSDSDDDDLFSSDDDTTALEGAFAAYDMRDSDTGGFGVHAPPAAAAHSTTSNRGARNTDVVPAPAPAGDDGDDSDADFFTNPLYQQRRYTAPSARSRAEAGGRAASRATGGSRGSNSMGADSEDEGVSVEDGVTGKWITRGRQRCYVLSTGRVLTGAAAMRTYRAMQDAGQHDVAAHRSTPKSKSKSKAKTKTTRKSKKNSADAASERKTRGSKRSSGAPASRSRSRARGTVNDAFAPDANAGAYAYEDAAMEEFEQSFGRATAPPAASTASSTASRSRSTVRPRATTSSSASSGAAAAAPAVGAGLASTFHDSPLFARVQSRVAPAPTRAAPPRPGLIRALDLPVINDISANDVGADGQVRGGASSGNGSNRSGGARGERKRVAKEPSGRGKRARAEPEPPEATVVSASILPRALAVNTVVRPGVLSRAAQAPHSGATGTNTNITNTSASSGSSSVSTGPRKSGADLMQSFLGKR